MLEVIIIVVCFIALMAVSGIVASSTARERRSVKSYHRTVETLSKVSEREGSSVRILRKEDPVRLDLSHLDDLTDPDMIRVIPEGGKIPKMEPTRPEPPLPEPPLSRPVPLVIGEDDDAFTAEREAVPQPRTRSKGRSSRLSGTALAAGGGVVVLVVAVVAFFQFDSATKVPVAAHRSKRISAPAKSTPKTTTKKVVKKTPKPAAAPTALTPTSTSPTGATYVVPGGVGTVVIRATAPCWVEESATPGGTILWDEVLPAGGSYQLNGNGGTMWLRSGNSQAMTLTVNGLPVNFTSPPGAYNYTFDS